MQRHPEVKNLAHELDMPMPRDERDGLIAWRCGGRGVRRCRRVDDCFGAGKPGKKWCHFQWHLVAGHGERRRRDLYHFQTIIPGVELDSSAQWQGCDLVQFVEIESRSGVHQGQHAIQGTLMISEAGTQVWSQQRLKR